MPWLSSTSPTDPARSSAKVADHPRGPAVVADDDGDDVGAGCHSASSSGPTLSWQLPKRSTHRTSACSSSASMRGSGTRPGTSSAGSTGGAELGEVDAVAEVGGRRSEDVAPGERGARRARAGRRRWSSSTARRRAAGDGDRRGEQPVVGADEDAGAVGHLDGDGPAGGADAGIDDREHDALGNVGDGPGERQGAGAHVVGADAVGEVDRRDVRREVADHRLDDADELVVEAVVGEQRHGVVATCHQQGGYGRATAPGGDRRRDDRSRTRRGLMPTPRWHQPRRRCRVTPSASQRFRSLRRKTLCEKCHVRKTVT